MEKTIYLGMIEPVVLFGINNVYFEKMKNTFPKLKLIARGNELKIVGESAEIEIFESKINLLVEHFNYYHSIKDSDIDRLLCPTITPSSTNTSSDEDILVYGENGKPIKARTPNQQLMVSKIKNNDMLFAVGPAGSGKTYTAIALAVRALRNKEVRRIVLSRPAVEAGERLGFLPGDLKEKIDPYLQPLYDALNDMIPPKKLEAMIEEQIVQIAPLAYMRGRTLDNAFVILDEAQNTTIAQIKMFLTRMGTSSKFIVTGDVTQIDLPPHVDSGMVHALRILQNVDGIAIVKLTEIDIVRHELVKKIVAAYEKDYQLQKSYFQPKEPLEGPVKKNT